MIEFSDSSFHFSFQVTLLCLMPKVRSHHVFGPLEIEITFDTPRGEKIIRSQLSSLAGHGLSRSSPDSSEFLDFIIDRFSFWL